MNSVRTTPFALSTTGGRFRVAAIAEACSWGGLLIGMFVKYVVVKNQVGVQVFGPIHGVLFLVYLTATLLAARAEHWTRGVTAVGLLASIPPFGTLVFERWAARSGALQTT